MLVVGLLELFGLRELVNPWHFSVTVSPLAIKIEIVVDFLLEQYLSQKLSYYKYCYYF
jgi:hypothetical protein